MLAHWLCENNSYLYPMIGFHKDDKKTAFTKKKKRKKKISNLFFNIFLSVVYTHLSFEHYSWNMAGCGRVQSRVLNNMIFSQKEWIWQWELKFQRLSHKFAVNLDICLLFSLKSWSYQILTFKFVRITQLGVFFWNISFSFICAHFNKSLAEDKEMRGGSRVLHSTI